MRSWVASAFVLGSVHAAAAADLPPSPSPADYRTMMFAGADAWRSGTFGHGGLVWAPGGLSADGFVLKLLAAGGMYTYLSGLKGGTEIEGQQLLAAILPGWHLRYGALDVVAHVGLDYQRHTLSPHDPDNALQGDFFGVRAGVDLWYQPAERLMVAANASVSTIGAGYWTRLAAGTWILDRAWIGPEALALGDDTYRQWRLGVHVTGLRVGATEWSVAGGAATDSDERTGGYLRFGVLWRR